MPFLFNYTNPATNSLSAYYKSAQGVDERSSDHECARDTPSDRPDESEDEGAADNVWLDESSQLCENSFLFGNCDEQWWDEIIFTRNSLRHAHTLDHNHLQSRMTRVSLDLTTIYRSQCRKHDGAPFFDEETFKSLFTHDNVAEFTELYFDRWSPHCPILHRQTFDLTNLHPPLLLAVFLIGESYSHEVSLAQAYYDIAEAYTFNHPKFRELLEDESPSSLASSHSLEPLQAAYLMVLLQMCGKNIKSRRRVRNVRYNEVIQAARALNLFDSKNEYLDREQTNCVEFDWRGFVVKESKIR